MIKYIQHDIYIYDPARCAKKEHRPDGEHSAKAAAADRDMYRDEDRPDDEEPGMMPAYDSYVADRMAKPEYRRIKIGLDRVERSLGAIASRNQHLYKPQTLAELGHVLDKLHEIEMLAEKIDDTLVWEYIIDYIEMLVDVRRHMVAELRWELQSENNCQASA